MEEKIKKLDKLILNEQKKSKGTKILICPKCGSIKWQTTTRPPTESIGINFLSSGEVGIIAGNKECLDCLYVGTFLETTADKVKDIKNKLSKNKHATKH